ncbi:MAG: phosphoribosyltransferase [Candidatus Thorarchaeota archaeon]
MTFIPYESREIAGQLLANFFLNENSTIAKFLKEAQNSFFVFAIPNGGVPVAEGFCKFLHLKYDILIVRKIKIPYNPEAGFGSITTDGSILINESLLSQLRLSQKQVEISIQKTKVEIQERIKFYKKNFSQSKYQNLINNKYVIIMDDGLASGFTMLAGINMIKKYNPKGIYISVPTAPYHTIKRLQKEVNYIFCPNIRKATWFAVADAYRCWYDVSETEVLKILINSISYIENI